MSTMRRSREAESTPGSAQHHTQAKQEYAQCTDQKSLPYGLADFSCSVVRFALADGPANEQRRDGQRDQNQKPGPENCQRSYSSRPVR